MKSMASGAIRSVAAMSRMPAALSLNGDAPAEKCSSRSGMSGDGRRGCSTSSTSLREATARKIPPARKATSLCWSSRCAGESSSPSGPSSATTPLYNVLSEIDHDGLEPRVDGRRKRHQPERLRRRARTPHPKGPFRSPGPPDRSNVRSPSCRPISASGISRTSVRVAASSRRC